MPPESQGFNPDSTCSPRGHWPGPVFTGETEAGGGCFVLLSVPLMGLPWCCSSCLHLKGAPWVGGELGVPPTPHPILTSVAVLGREMHKNSPSSLSCRPLFWEAGPSLLASWDTIP